MSRPEGLWPNWARLGVRALAVALLGMAVENRGLAAGPPDLALVLAIDCSDSVSAEDYRLELDGLADALTDPDVIAAARAGPGGSTAIAAIQWSDMDVQSVVIPWTSLSGASSAEALAQRIRDLPRDISGYTSISGAILAATKLLDSFSGQSTRRVIDTISDGVNNDGARPEVARDQALAQGLTINGLAILSEVPYLDDYFRNHVIEGPGSFVLKAEGYRDFHVAMKRKLLREMLPPVASGAASAAGP